MNRIHRALQIALSALLAAAIAGFAVVAGPAASASAATATYLSMHPTAASPVAGQQVTLQVFTGSLAGNYPAGSVNVMVEGTGMMVGAPVSTVDGGAQLNIGNFPIGTITVNASFTPSDGTTYAPTTAKISVTIAGASLSIHPLIPTAPALGHPVVASTLMSLGSGNGHAPGGTVNFVVAGQSVAACVPQPTALAANWTCQATLPAPTKSGLYTVTAAFSGSAYYVPSSGSQTFTIAAEKVAPAKPVAAPAPAPVGAGSPTPTATPSSRPRATASALPVAADDAADARDSTTASAGAWPWLFLVALLLLLGAIIAVVVLLRRRPGSSVSTGSTRGET